MQHERAPLFVQNAVKQMVLPDIVYISPISSANVCFPTPLLVLPFREKYPQANFVQYMFSLSNILHPISRDIQHSLVMFSYSSFSLNFIFYYFVFSPVSYFFYPHFLPLLSTLFTFNLILNFFSNICKVELRSRCNVAQTAVHNSHCRKC